MRFGAVLFLLLAVSAASCTRGVERVTDVLTATPAAPPSPPGSVSPPSATTSPADGQPAIVIENPVPGAEIGSPVIISGNADTFEATVGVRIVDENGQELSATVTMATCGTGCRGTFSQKLFFFVDDRQPGAVVAFETSAKDGSEINVVTVPVTLVPGG